MNFKLQQPRNQSGVLLIEVLVSLLIFSVGILGLIAMQAKATNSSYYSEDRGRASILASEIVASMWNQKTLSLPQATIDAWNARVKNSTVSGLPSANGTVAPDANGVVTVTITWQEPSLPTQSQYITQIAMP
ncbi:type IV pilus modification protein PilV [Undibacterium sp. Dicai25W]|uniref:type IV pilus modification protein PilV n=1 Tax=Undibacterium sp. Dicai25W TaxID=3413034 RepID=UPI003BF39C0E